MSTTVDTEVTTVTCQVYVKARPEQIWDAITNGDTTDRYGYRGRVEYDLRPGGAYSAYPSEAMKAMGASGVIVEGEVIEVEPERRLVETWHALFGPDTAAEPAGIVSWELEPGADGVTKLTVTHTLEDAPVTAGYVSGSIPGTGGGWPFIVSDLKTLLETGSSLSPC